MASMSTDRYVERRCPDCKGSGLAPPLDWFPCETCRGSGGIFVLDRSGNPPVPPAAETGNSQEVF